MWCGKHTHVIRKTIATSLGHCCKNIRTLQQIRLLDTNWVNLWLVVWNMAFMTFHVECHHPNWPASMVFCHISCGCFVCFVVTYGFICISILFICTYCITDYIHCLRSISMYVSTQAIHPFLLYYVIYIYIYTPSEYVLSGGCHLTLSIINMFGLHTVAIPCLSYVQTCRYHITW